MIYHAAGESCFHPVLDLCMQSFDEVNSCNAWVVSLLGSFDCDVDTLIWHFSAIPRLVIKALGSDCSPCNRTRESPGGIGALFLGAA